MPDLQTLIQAIPVAEDGHVITREYHNSVLEAIKAMARQIEGTPTGRIVSETFAPHFYQNTPQPAWISTMGAATNGGNTARCEGWLPILLPNDAQILRLVAVVGRVGPFQGNPFSFRIRLQRQRLNQPNNIDQLITISDLPVGPDDEGDPLEREGRIQGDGNVSLKELQTVKNELYRYFVEARLIGVPQGVTIRVYALRVEYSR